MLGNTLREKNFDGLNKETTEALRIFFHRKEGFLDLIARIDMLVLAVVGLKVGWTKIAQGRVLLSVF